MQETHMEELHLWLLAILDTKMLQNLSDFRVNVSLYFIAAYKNCQKYLSRLVLNRSKRGDPPEALQEGAEGDGL